MCEVLSPSTFRVDRTKKLPIYHREGVGHAWLVDPAAETLEVYRRHELGWLLVATFEGDDVVRAEPFDAIELSLAALERAAAAATEVRVGADPRMVIGTLGAGRTADEALRIALFCVYVSRGVRDALTLAVAHEGDTDATASLVGAVLGVTGGEQVLPPDWIAALELRQEIETLADDLSRAPTENLDDGDRWARYPGC